MSFDPPLTASGAPCKRCTGLGELCHQHQGDYHPANYKLTPKNRERYLDQLRDGATKGVAAARIGVSRQAIWFAERDDAEFAEAVERAYALGTGEAEDQLQERRRAGDTTAIIYTLKQRAPDDWNKELIRTEVAEKEIGRLMRTIVNWARSNLTEIQAASLVRELLEDRIRGYETLQIVETSAHAASG